MNLTEQIQRFLMQSRQWVQHPRLMGVIKSSVQSLRNLKLRSINFRDVPNAIKSRLSQFQFSKLKLTNIRFINSRTVTGSALFFAVCALGAATVAPLAPDAADLPIKRVSEELSLPSLQEQIEKIAQQEQRFVREGTLKSSEPIAQFLLRVGVHDDEASEFIKSNSISKAILQLRTDKAVTVKTGEHGDLRYMQFIVQEGDKPPRNIVVQRDHHGKLMASETSANLERRVEMASAYIRSAFYAAADEALIPYNVTEQVKTMFETSVDYQRLQRGDYFNVVYESFWQNGQRVSTGRVLAGEFFNNGKLYEAAWFDEAGTKGGYYTLDGKALKRAFLRSPIEFTRVSSGFSMRVHPISGQWKAHKGVDFAAATGTPIRATADGVVDHAGPSGGYGNLVVIKHHSNISTAYAHMSRFANGVRKGTRVSQGDVIGYVGSTGWSTGPHLHYEFRVNNEARDPLAVKTNDAPPLAGAEMNRFKVVAAELRHRLTLMNPARKENTIVAQGSPLAK